MRDVLDAVSVAQLAVFALLAGAAVSRWRARRDRAAAWMAATFAVLAVVLVGRRLVPPESTTASADLARKLLVATLALFPYCLFRFGATLSRPARPLRVAAALLTVVAVVAVFPFDEVPTRGEPRSTAFQAYTLLILTQWAVLILWVAHQLWWAGRGRPTVVRRRMRLLSLAATGITLVLALGVATAPADEPHVAQVITAGATLLVAPLFLLGFAPPSPLLALWRRRDERALREAAAGLMAAMSEEEVADALLPHVTRALGGTAAIHVAGDGVVLSSYRATPERAAELAEAARTGASCGSEDAGLHVLTVPLAAGALVVETDPYTPYFAHEETGAMRDLALLTDVALRRAAVARRERALAAELAQANEAMRDFVAIASHDLRTPISVVRGYASILRDSWDAIADADKRSYLETIDRQAAHLSRIVDDLLTVSRIDAGALEPDCVTLPLATVVEQTVRDLAPEIDVRIGIEPDVVAVADRDHLVRIVRNLVENAVAYGRPPVEITASATDGTVDLRVRDHGSGVDADFEPRLFERFARFDTARSRETRGTGLGLSIVRGLARADGGDVWYERVPGGGACFVVRLPTRREDGRRPPRHDASRR